MGASRARSKLGAWFRDPENQAFFAELSQRGLGWRRVSSVLVKHGLITVKPAFHEPGPEGEKERDRVAAYAKRLWFRVRPRDAVPQQLPAPAELAASAVRQPRVRPVVAENPPPAAQGEADPSNALARLDRQLRQRSGRGKA
ncbi:hypothetical protein EAH89_25645 [Roseomonas nepalensis]|uniref:Uncharacterized protein n=1 Tax=Muricoccus nepalensis TaxID=1854500 RepID=A0A502F9G2_9PROT|nr:hypothetical protein EAH89_25645 [Roseomonas nepalensis]